MIYAANVGEEDLADQGAKNKYVKARDRVVQRGSRPEQSRVVPGSRGEAGRISPRFSPPQMIREKAAKENCEVVLVSAQVESELISLSAEERKEFLGEGGALVTMGTLP